MNEFFKLHSNHCFLKLPPHRKQRLTPCASPPGSHLHRLCLQPPGDSPQVLEDAGWKRATTLFLLRFRGEALGDFLDGFYSVGVGFEWPLNPEQPTQTVGD